MGTLKYLHMDFKLQVKSMKKYKFPQFSTTVEYGSKKN
jgi:hypothetical protein